MIRRFKKWLARHRRGENKILRFGIGVFDAVVQFLRVTWKLITNRDTRSIYYNKMFNSKNIHQTTSSTCLDRYPEIFAAARDYFLDKKPPRILSFGCSTGEEVVTLCRYFPNSEIVGAEINQNSLRICRSLTLGDRVRFIESTPENIAAQGPYDLIFCMAVLQRTPGTIQDKQIRDLKKIYPFEKFQQKVEELDGLLNKNGLLVIHMSQYDLPDTDLAPRYHPYGDWNQNYYGPYVFGPDSKIKTITGNRHSIFVKDC
ncbi:MAG: methyltransferase domain-containing protein [Oscillospiraceae bacterium]|nr:methyltransferase domain-containing protein [Oscillospiraceae bacterium]